MKLFFAPVSVDSGLGGFITNKPKVLYQHFIEYGSGPGETLDFTISDAVGRSVPISITDIDALIVALNEVRCIAENIVLAQGLHEAVTNPDTYQTLDQ